MIMSSKPIPKTRKSIKTKIKEEEPSLTKIMRFIGWIYLILIVGIMGLIVFEVIKNHDLFDGEGILESIKSEISIYKLGLALLFGVSAGVFFGMSDIIKENPERKKELFISSVLTEFLVSIILILGIAFANPIPW